MAAARKKLDLYRGRDPRNIPTYSFSEASRCLQIPLETLRSWIRGRSYSTTVGQRKLDPVIQLPDVNLPLLSFTNLIEAHVLDAIRYRHKVPLENVRRAVKYLRDRSGSRHPLADYWFQLKGVDLLIEEGGLLVNATKQGQLVMKDIIQAYLTRVERDPTGAALRLYPYLHRHPKEPEYEPKLVLIDPRISFGKPILVGVGVPTAVVADRHKAGESIAELAKDYGCEATEIEKAIQYERGLQKAA
ncbi:MAG TPA: DUF433 domain-containing protein [Blastocatellia bacterium]|nr:DUF433 domain-containing protein [Blastocatellia bacterium]